MMQPMEFTLVKWSSNIGPYKCRSKWAISYLWLSVLEHLEVLRVGLINESVIWYWCNKFKHYSLR